MDTTTSAQPSKSRINLLGMSQDKLGEFFKELGEKPFRVQQVMKWIHHEGVQNFDEMTNLSKVLRAKLNECAEVREPEVTLEKISKDGTRKWLVKVENGSCVETVFIPQGKRGTLCISSQVGCALDCSFCSTGKQGFSANLSTAEIVGQVRMAIRSLKETEPERQRAVSNVVFMGMGEPLLNFDNVVDAVSLIMDDLGYGISKRRVTVSTAGVVPALYKLAEVSDVSLAVSLHAPTDELRNELVPINRKYPIEQLMEACQHYLAGLGEHRAITIEYTLMDGINDKPEHACQLAELLKDLECKINLIPFNPFPGSGYKTVTDENLETFQRILYKKGCRIMVRTTRGEDIDAACGQLVGKFNDRTGRSARHQRRLEANKINVLPLKHEAPNSPVHSSERPS
ncbi:MAG: 23S rRNA (adenine(2503)-C(2))-methyltransferase RlmN [Pseudomonadales bacterium]|nr:23S rRNA (adenine(2503)-C(2))-methyltransferase RlmN [Pseudomonadales bacterium]